METPTFQELKHGVLQTFKAPALFLPSSISYTSTADQGYQQVTAKREDYAAHPSLNLAVTKEQFKEPDLSLTLPFTVAPSICIFQADWMSRSTFEVVCFEPEATKELMYIRWGMMQFNMMHNNCVWECRQVSKLLKGQSSTLTIQPFHQAAALLVNFMNAHFR